MIATEKFRLIRAFSPPLSEIPRPADTISHKPNCIRRGNLSGFAIFFLTGNVSRETFCTEKFRKTLYKAKKSCYNKIVLVCVKATPHKARLTALHAICVQIFRHIAQKSLAIRQYACGISRQSAEKSDNAPYAQALCGVALKEKTPTKNRLLLSAKTGHFHYPNATSSVIIRANPTAKKIVPTLE